MSFGCARGQFGAIAVSTTGGEGHVVYFATCCASAARRPGVSLPHPAGGGTKGGRCVPGGPGGQPISGGGPSSSALASETTEVSRLDAPAAASQPAPPSTPERSDPPTTST